MDELAKYRPCMVEDESFPFDIKATDGEQIFSFMNEYVYKGEYYPEEHFHVISLNAKCNIVAVKEVAIGDSCSAIVSASAVFRTAILSCATSILLVHNHPSGEAAASPDDVKMTKRLIESGDILNIRVADHIIIGEGEYVSMRSMHQAFK